MTNAQIAAILNELADFMELSGENPFKVNAYRRAARSVENSRHAVAELRDHLEELPGVGKGTAGVIEEIIATGRSGQLEELRQQLPPELPDLLHIPGLGPKSIYTLYRELDITNLQALQTAAEQQQIRELPGFGPKKEQKILEEIARFGKRPERRLLHEALRVAHRFKEQLAKGEKIIRVEMAGSIRRLRETIKDIDFVVATREPGEVSEWIVSLPEVVEVVNQGETKVSVIVEAEGIEMSVDVRLVTPDQFASAWHHFTGSKEHNVRIRQRAKQYGWKVSEYGIFNPETEETKTFADEADFFSHLELPYIPPELREDRGEMEKAEQGELPELIRIEDYRGDLHMHSLYSDGADSIYKMAKAAQERGYEYIAITDHSQSLKVASGLTMDEIFEQWEEIQKVNEELENFTILRGTEMDILPDGRLDFPDELLEQMDIVIASIHSSFRQDEKTMTRRIVEAMENPHVDIIAHPTGRLIQRRDPYQVDIDDLFQTAADTGTILELNANPHRLDLNDELLKKAKEEYGLTFTINTDAHSAEGLANIFFGIATARRGWLEKQDVINTMPLKDLRKRLKKGK
ncbi:DNA polymerase/3'-5' exonuclease PolX [Paenactinomyces guangxiensis]|uniref:DNA polymerase beta n=1 Tax=Paenactinomyces guangxiensis TaxID=1490290 RepID=A0A7W2A8E4_9BACL|nr:DNA polymerase/3'-5' exonuclease PolX [Paenactinomyces guangxiensis]MBA4494555.1 DNA polymerase/3'-5' exonuclease PolX [Paenactinomyces guangxiensis]MBH8591683.1 DNA polymerase/3'-5' exonuclease PolX [Paenactinomyces guangxiensis]